MIVNGIVAEYNPLHHGHIYQIQDAKTNTQADYTIVVMSGNFVQRGAPALLDKFSRTRMALEAGADLVLELPLPYAVSSAEFFATGAVTLLHHLGVVTHLCFGSECGDTGILQELAGILSEEPPAYRQALQQALKEGLPYPVARTLALSYDPASNQEHAKVLASPNNILGIEYIKALLRLNSSILPYTTLRTGNGYSDDTLGTLSSALAIRQAIFSGTDLPTLADHVPTCTYELLLTALEKNTLLSSNDFSSLLHYKLITKQTQGYEDYLDVSGQLSDRICNHLYQYQTFDSFCDLLKTKDLTHTRIRRCLLHILLNIKRDTLSAYKQLGTVPYARVLGFCKKATPLLTAIKERSSIPMITKLADAHNILHPDALLLLEQELTMNQIYYSVASAKSGTPIINEYRTPIVIL